MHRFALILSGLLLVLPASVLAQNEKDKAVKDKPEKDKPAKPEEKPEKKAKESSRGPAGAGR